MSVDRSGNEGHTVPEKTKQARHKRQQPKDRVLQARIPEQLDDELRDRAEKLGLSVSTIVRNVLLHTFDLVEDVVIDGAQIARALTGRHSPASTSNSEMPVIGWQEIILNKNGVCEECNVMLPIGQPAAIGVPTGSRATLLCMKCLAALPSSIDDTTAPTVQEKAKKRRARNRSSGSKD
ncbi:MAG: hypothetical protein ABJL54_10490 [Halioglobus sp.]